MVALIGVVGTLIAAVLSPVLMQYGEKIKNKEAARREIYEVKREKLTRVYKNLISIINIYPNASPNDVLKNVDYPPNYSMEHFDAVLNILEYQIEDYTKKLEGTISSKYDIEVQISNREYAKKQIYNIHENYNNAKEKYKEFYESDKVLFDLYAGQDVRNSLVMFEVIINNVFISGYCAGNPDDPIKNLILISKRNLIDSIRNDIGI